MIADTSRSTFNPIVIGAHYPSINRGLAADILAARALDADASTVCTAHVVAGHGRVTDVLEVPTDSVSAQLEHLIETASPTAAKVGVIGHPATIEVVAHFLRNKLEGPVIWDVTLSGPSGEDVIGRRGLEALFEHIHVAGLVTVRRQDAELLAGMEISSLDDAQVAVQRITQRGAARVLLRCGRIATHYFEDTADASDFAVDLYYDGDDFSLFEAPHLTVPDVHGASGALTLAILRELTDGCSVPEAIRAGKAYVTEALRHAQARDNARSPCYFWREHAPMP